MATIKRYYAYVVADLASYFEERCNKEDKVKIFSKELVTSESGEPLLFCYVIEAEDGLIDPEWELK